MKTLFILFLLMISFSEGIRPSYADLSPHSHAELESPPLENDPPEADSCAEEAAFRIQGTLIELIRTHDPRDIREIGKLILRCPKSLKALIKITGRELAFILKMVAESRITYTPPSKQRPVNEGLDH